MSQPVKILATWLQQQANRENYLFRLADFRALLPQLSLGALKTLLSRMVSSKYLERVCRGLYAYKPTKYAEGLLLFHAAAYLRSNCFNYLSLETVLSDAGVISQLPINTIFLMSSGRSNKIFCGRFGTIEFVHTQQRPQDIGKELTYDADCRLWRASVRLALRDMQRTQRNQDLIDFEVAHEFI